MKRIYEYEDEEGRRFWSFHKLQPTVSFGHSMKLLDRLGEHYLIHINKIKTLVRNGWSNRNDE